MKFIIISIIITLFSACGSTKQPEPKQFSNLTEAVGDLSLEEIQVMGSDRKEFKDMDDFLEKNKKSSSDPH